MAIGDFWNRIRRLFRQPSSPRAPSPRGPSRPTQPIQRQPVVSPQPVTAPGPVGPPAGPLDYGSVIELIHKAGRELKMLNITYDGLSREVEPYSFREKSTGRLFYGFCSIHGRIHSFKPERMTHCEISQKSFNPRWEVEL